MAINKFEIMQIDHNKPYNLYHTGKWYPMQINDLNYRLLIAHIKRTIKRKYYNVYYQEINPLKIKDYKGKEYTISTLGNWFFGRLCLPKKFRLKKKDKTWYIQISDYIPEKLRSCILIEFVSGIKK
ncbi:hypothetical protein SH1V18_48370 [Vallitalea longa]|uniref:Uncharacterized protein n=1 Tax=Vallitalea longa TaxID=2936439 RepID=A0A9W6DI83_9FIRM|nr:hypothetical protein [Vallitalea longa]GKX32357.1 hypothetical protein SH1V18_48370 [Vallitalea longa]